MLSIDKSETNRNDSCKPIKPPSVETISEQTALLSGLDGVEYTLVDISAEDFRSSHSANDNDWQEKFEEANDKKSTLCLAPKSAAVGIAALMLNEQLLVIANVEPASNIQQTFCVVLGTLEDEKATDSEQRRASPMQRWTSQLWSNDPWCILGMIPTAEEQNKRTGEVTDTNEQKTEESTRDFLSSDNSSEVWSIDTNGGSDVGLFA